MKKLIVGLVILSSLPFFLYAANTCTRTDFECYQSGPSQNLNTQWRVDSSGNVTANGNATVTGNLSVTGTSTLTGASTLSGAQTVSGLVNYPATAVTGLTSQSTSTVSVTSTYETVTSTSGNITLTALPNISTATALGGTTALADGTILVITSTGSANAVSISTVTFQDNLTLSGSQLHLGAATRAVWGTKVLGLIYKSATNFWYELFYANNN